MRHVVPAILILVAITHALPLAGVLGPATLERLYGLSVQDPNLELLLRHRAVLFGMIAALLAYAAFHPPLHRLALLAGLISVASFLVLAPLTGPLNEPLRTVVRADGVALVLLVIGAALDRASPAAA